MPMYGLLYPEKNLFRLININVICLVVAIRIKYAEGHTEWMFSRNNFVKIYLNSQMKNFLEIKLRYQPIRFGQNGNNGAVVQLLVVMEQWHELVSALMNMAWSLILPAMELRWKISSVYNGQNNVMQIGKWEFIKYHYGPNGPRGMNALLLVASELFPGQESYHK